MDVFELAGLALWIFVVFGIPLLKKKRKRPPEQQYPDFPEDTYNQGDTSGQDTSRQDTSERERKLKEWLENVFGKMDDAGTEENDAGRQEEDTYTDHYSPPPAEQAAPVFKRPAFYVAADTSESAEYTSVAVGKNPWRGRIGKNQMAYGMVMAEVFAKPLALRQAEHSVFARKKLPRQSGAEVRPACR